MIKVYFVEKEEFDLYDKSLEPQGRWMNSPLNDLGIKNLLCGDGTLAVCPEHNAPDNDLPAKFYLVTEKKPVGGA